MSSRASKKRGRREPGSMAIVLDKPVFIDPLSVDAVSRAFGSVWRSPRAVSFSSIASAPPRAPKPDAFTPPPWREQLDDDELGLFDDQDHLVQRMPLTTSPGRFAAGYFAHRPWLAPKGHTVGWTPAGLDGRLDVERVPGFADLYPMALDAAARHGRGFAGFNLPKPLEWFACLMLGTFGLDVTIPWLVPEGQAAHFDIGGRRYVVGLSDCGRCFSPPLPQADADLWRTWAEDEARGFAERLVEELPAPFADFGLLSGGGLPDMVSALCMGCRQRLEVPYTGLVPGQTGVNGDPRRVGDFVDRRDSFAEWFTPLRIRHLGCAARLADRSQPWG